MKRFDTTPARSPIPLIAAGKGWLAANKPWGMSVHNAPGRDLCAQLALDLQQDPALGRRIGWDPQFGIHPAHRLDRETSGVILLACRRDTLGILAGQFRSGRITKRYHALVHGHLEEHDAADGWALWQRPLSANAGGRSNPAGTGPRKPCCTRYRITAHSAHYTLLACEPVTGRQHQIRRHAKLAGHPVVGDKRYGSRRSCDFLVTQRNFSRLGLHAAAITFTPPGKKQPLTVRTEALPREMARLLETDPVLGKTDPVLGKTDPVLEKTDPALEKTDPVLEKTDPALEKTDPALGKIRPGPHKEGR